MAQWHVAKRRTGTRTWTLDLEPHSRTWAESIVTLCRQFGDEGTEYVLIPAEHVIRYLCVRDMPTLAQFNTLSVFMPQQRGWDWRAGNDGQGCIDRGWLARNVSQRGYEITQSGMEAWRREYMRRRELHRAECGVGCG